MPIALGRTIPQNLASLPAGVARWGGRTLHNGREGAPVFGYRRERGICGPFSSPADGDKFADLRGATRSFFSMRAS